MPEQPRTLESDALVEHFFRHQSANLVAVLTRAFGMSRFELVEDAVQSALIEATLAWPRQGIPDNPAGWLHRVAKNRVLDTLRREKVHQQALAFSGMSETTTDALVEQWLECEQIADSLLRMMFVCCHPLLDRKTQIALTLKTLCGFSVQEIARGLLLPRETVKKRIQRAKKALRDAHVQMELPPAQELSRRLEVVHDVLYLMFNEGYSTSQGEMPIRDDICEESARLCHLLCQSEFHTPATLALLALLLFHSARLEARVDSAGSVILLEDQDRTQWDRRLILAGQNWLAQSKTNRPSPFHLEAAIVMQHCLADSVATTDWKLIVALYDRLLELHDSPIYALNRAIAIGQDGAPQQALAILQSLRQREGMQEYLLLDCAVARMHELANKPAAAIDAYLAALSKSTAEHERQLIEAKLRRLSG